MISAVSPEQLEIISRGVRAVWPVLIPVEYGPLPGTEVLMARVGGRVFIGPVLTPSNSLYKTCRLKDCWAAYYIEDEPPTTPFAIEDTLAEVVAEACASLARVLCREALK